MSVDAVKAVWEWRHVTPIQKLVAVRLADHASPDGSNAYPSVGHLAEDTGLAERTIQVALRSLVEAGYLVHEGSAPKGMRKYRIILVPPQEMHPAAGAPPQEMHPPSDGGVHLTAERGAGDAPESLVEPLVKPTALVLVEEPRQRRTKRPADLTLTDARLRAGVAVGMTNETAEAEWQGVLDYAEQEGKSYKSWDAAWRTRCRNWVKFGSQQFVVAGPRKQSPFLVAR